MRRILLLAVLAAPAVALPAIPAPDGKVIDFNNYSADPTWLASFVNAAMCSGGESLQLEWKLASFSTQTGTYSLYASNKDPAQSTGTDAGFCAIQNDDNTGTKAGPIAGHTALTQQTAIQRDTTVSGVAAVTPAGLVCNDANDGQVFWICAHFSVGGTRTSAAVGKFFVQVKAPGAPTLTGASPGNGRITANWNIPTSGAPADHYVIQATPVGGGDAKSSGNLTGTSGDVTGLDNSLTYDVVVFAFSIGGNRSVASNSRQVQPIPTAGFWEVYESRGGADAGGCASGPGGALAILATAALLVLRRRRS